MAKQARRYGRRVRRRRLGRRLLVAAFALTALLLLAERNIRPLVLSMAQARSAAMCSQVLSGAVAEALGDGVGYEELMNVLVDERGQVALLSANTVRMNLLADRAADAALRRLQRMSSETINVPLGAALGMTLLAGSGPQVPVSIVPIGSISTDFATEFEAVGINQTRHKVYLQVTASIQIVIPTGTKTTQVTANMLVAESIIVGAVPESFVGYHLSENELGLVH